MRRNQRRREANRRSIIDMLETTPATVAHPYAPRMMDESLGEDLDFDWRPRPLERAVDGNRSFRWPIIGAALVLAALAILLVQGLGTFSEAQANERLTAYRAAIVDFEDALDELEAALPDIEVAESLAFGSATASLRDVATEPLPGLPPFVPQGALGDVSQAQRQLVTMVDIATSISSDLTVSATFTEASKTLFAPPPLPSSAPESLIGAAGTAITDMQSSTLATLSSLEANDTFATYLDEVGAALAGLPEWTDRYLLALRRGDAETAEVLIGAIQAQRQLLDDELAVGLATIAKGVEERLADLRVAIDRARVLTTTG